MVMGSLPPGLKSPNSTSATAWPVSWPRYQHSKIAGTFRLSIVDGERAAVEQQHDHRFAGGQHGVDQFLLPADQVEAGAVAQVLGRPGLARRLFVAADGEHDHIGAPGDLDGLGDLFAIFLRIARRDFVLCPGAADRDLAAFAVEHLRALADAGVDAVEHGDVVLRHAAVAAEQTAIGVGADDGDGLDARADRAAADRLRSSAA